MEEAIAKGFKRIIPNIKVLYCVRHLKQNDEMKLDSLMGKVTASAAEKSQAKSEILKDIYGERKDSAHDFGLAEAANDEDFLGKLNFLHVRWKSLHPGFLKWFCDNRLISFLKA